jgi:hypothetical protein
VQVKSLCIERFTKRQDVILINSVSSAVKSGVYRVQVANLGSKDIWIKANIRLEIVGECDKEPQQDSQLTFLETEPKEKTVVLKEDVEEVDMSSIFNAELLIPDNLDCSKEQHQNILDL